MARISSGTMTVVIFAILVGLGGALVVRQQLAQARMTPAIELPNAPQMTIVPTAAMDLQPGQMLSINEIALVTMSPEKYRDSRYSKIAFMRNPEQISGRMLREPIKKGEPFLPESFFPANAGPGIADRLSPGYRAVTVPIENVGAVQGFAGPGSFVDVLFRSQLEGERPEVTLTLLERVQVLALATNILPGQQVQISGDGTVTLAVTPQQAKILKVVEGRGELSLTLRGTDDDVDMVPFELGLADPNIGPAPASIPATVGLASRASATTMSSTIDAAAERVTLDDLLGLPTQLPKKQMEIYLGADKKVVEFDRSAGRGQQLLQNGGMRTPIARDTNDGRARVRSSGRAPASRLPIAVTTGS